MKETDIPDKLSDLDNYLSQREAAYNLKEGSEAEIVWQSEIPRKTDYSIVYLHGFRASHPEGNPVHLKIAKHLGCNLFLSRMDEHGIETEYPLLHLTEDKLLRSAKFALEIGQRIGRRVILMGTSTGGSLALWLASQNNLKEKISSLILYSPLIRFYGIKEKLLMTSWGRGLLNLILGKKHLIKTLGTTYAEDRIWNKEYALNGALALGAFIDHYMNKKLFSGVQCPVFTGYYYKNSKAQDKVVSVSAIKKMKTKLGTRTDKLKFVNFPEAHNHVICSGLLSKSVPEVLKKTKEFLKTIGSQRTRENY